MRFQAHIFFFKIIHLPTTADLRFSSRWILNSWNYGAHKWRIGHNDRVYIVMGSWPVTKEDGISGVIESSWNFHFLEHTSLIFFSVSLLSSPSPLSMNSQRCLTSDSLTGFRRNSAAPSSKHLSLRAKIFSDDIITTGILLNADDSCSTRRKGSFTVNDVKKQRNIGQKRRKSKQNKSHPQLNLIFLEVHN